MDATRILTQTVTQMTLPRPWPVVRVSPARALEERGRGESLIMTGSHFKSVFPITSSRRRSTWATGVWNTHVISTKKDTGGCFHGSRFPPIPTRSGGLVDSIPSLSNGARSRPPVIERLLSVLPT